MERERERIEHPLHPHPLVLNDETKQGCSCSTCFECLSFDPSFSCGECDDFHLHKKCAHAPLEISPSPLHPDHPRLSLVSNIKCALLLHDIDENFNFKELKHFGHQHPLSLIENSDDQLVSRADCYRCRKPSVEADSLYVCLQSECRFYLHKKCAKLAALVDHPCHPSHPFILQFPESFLSCKVCERRGRGLFLRCSPCKLDSHIKCAWPPPIIEEDRSHHDHPFLRLSRSHDDSFTCDACGTQGNCVSYICLICNLQVHPNCTSLPHIIKTTRHHHRIIHKYFLQSMIKRRLTAKFVSLKSRQSTKKRASLVMKNWVMITSVIERNQHGDATKIQHSCHARDQHVLTLLSTSSNNEEEEEDDLDLDDKRCDGCMLSISNMSTTCSSFYSCCETECEFLLHKTCAELPRKMHLWFHRGPTTLDSFDDFLCNWCERLCSGFAYDSYCLRCSRGKDCTDNFVLDFACITMPETARHKCDQHLFKLAFHDKNEDDPEQYYCDVCEEFRDPNLWFYHCAICDKSAHPICVLGKYPFFNKKKMIGSASLDWVVNQHQHDLTFVKKMDEICSRCDKLIWEDVALECKQCNYIIHFECHYSL
ncbi:Protein kinase C-like, phorbol ester/diacylglycerol binding protein [Corchorus olitorius]|uniref:Protein kinase C-like, phorbol ester/diacylglycerol binding protein n=1 Tax=Corchorus olitorius TaxID=93759 RepID=A0A1R3GXE7_9ROSI|nr:Protein kinase C-like, phorbol ester/diacylglycerol binding protein [Corchorus olitorius]